MSLFEEPKTNISVFQSERGVLPCFELNCKFLERHKKLISLVTTRKQENPVNTARKWQAKVQPNKTKKQQSARIYIEVHTLY